MKAKCWWLGLAGLMLCPPAAWADGGTMRFSKLCDRYRITLFTSPTSLRAGVVDFSVLVQAADSETPLLDVPVTIHVHPETDPQLRMGGLATTSAATNKLFQAVEIELSRPGRWRVEVDVDAPNGSARVETDVEVGPPLPSWIDLGLWIGWPAGAILLFAIHLGLLQLHRQRRRGLQVRL